MGEKKRLPKQASCIVNKLISKTTGEKSITKMNVFNWEYLSFITIDSTCLYRELLLIPILLVLLWIVWMKVVRSSLQEIKGQSAMSLDEAYANAVISDALDTEDETEPEEAKKSDLNAEAPIEEKKDL